jgi:mannosyltransferase OCH1-like enzyme
MENIHRFAPEYEHMLYDDKDIAEFLTKYFVPDVLHAFHTLKLGAHKADLFRYCVMYIKGGVYLDIKTELIKPIHDLFEEGSINTVISRVSTEIYQGVIAAPPGQSIFLSLIEAITRRCHDPPYNLFIIDFMRYVTWDVGVDPKEGLNTGSRFKYHLLKETCSDNPSDCEDGLDRYNKCCNIYSSSKKEIKTRYADYPW